MKTAYTRCTLVTCLAGIIAAPAFAGAPAPRRGPELLHEGKLYIVDGATLYRVDMDTLKVEAKADLTGLGWTKERKLAEQADWIRRQDQNGDGVLSEADGRVWRWRRRQDRNGDGKVTREEADVTPPGQAGGAVLFVFKGKLVMLRNVTLFKFDLKTLKLDSYEHVRPLKDIPKPDEPGKDPKEDANANDGAF